MSWVQTATCSIPSNIPLYIAYFHAYIQICSSGKKVDTLSGKPLEKEK